MIDPVNVDLPTIAREIGALRGLRRVFVGNHLEISAALSIVQDPGRWLPLWSDPGAVQSYCDNLDRLLFNYLAAGNSISASAWKMRDRLGGDIAFPEYDAHNPYTTLGLPSFVFELRHVVQHDRVTVSVASLSFGQTTPGLTTGGPDFALSLKQLQSLRYGSTTRAAYVEALTSDLPLSRLVNGFTPELLAFTDWFMGALGNLAGSGA